MQEHKNN